MVKGEIVTDTLCLKEDKLNCISDVSFLAVDHASDIQKDRAGGLIGLSSLSDNGV